MATRSKRHRLSKLDTKCKAVPTQMPPSFNAFDLLEITPQNPTGKGKYTRPSQHTEHFAQTISRK